MELTEFLQRRWNTERFIVFQTAILQHFRNVTKLGNIRRRIYQRLDAWESEKHKILMEDMVRTCAQYLSTGRGEDSPDHREKVYHSLLIQEKLQSAVIWITKRERGGVFQTWDMCAKTGHYVFEVLSLKHLEARTPTASILEVYRDKPPAMVTVDITDAMIATVTRLLSGAALPVGVDLFSLQHWMLQFGMASIGIT